MGLSQKVSNTTICNLLVQNFRENIYEKCSRNRDSLLIKILIFSLFLVKEKYNHPMQPTIKELEEKYNNMSDEKIVSLLESEGMRQDAAKILKEIADERWLKYSTERPKKEPRESKNEIKIDSAQATKKIYKFWLYLKIFGALNMLIWVISMIVFNASKSQYVALIFIIIYWFILVGNGSNIQNNKEKNLFNYIKDILMYFFIYWIIESFLLGKLSLHIWFLVLVWWALYLDNKSWRFLEQNTKTESFSSTYLKILPISWALVLIFTNL